MKDSKKQEDEKQELMEKELEISVVIPVYGCPNAIPELYRRLRETLTGMEIGWEIVMVDDCDKLGSRRRRAIGS